MRYKTAVWQQDFFTKGTEKVQKRDFETFGKPRNPLFISISPGILNKYSSNLKLELINKSRLLRKPRFFYNKRRQAE